LPTHRAVLALDRNIGNFAFGAFQYGKQCLVAAVNIFTKFELALIIDESGLVGQVGMSAFGRYCSLIPGLGVKLSAIVLAGPTVLSAVGVSPPHDGVR
jgi:hypothetical protein